MPICFQFSLGEKTIIIDCFEVFIEPPSNLLARAQTFSNYKQYNTVKVLIPITPKWSICFTSKAWGRTSDKYSTDVVYWTTWSHHSGKHCTLPGAVSYSCLHWRKESTWSTWCGMNKRNCECANTCRACFWTPEAKVFYPGKKVEKFHLLTGWSGFVQPLQIFPHLLFPLNKLISFYKTFISLQTLVRGNWYLILWQSYIWYCIALASHCNNTSQKHINVEWCETIQNLAVSCINSFPGVSALCILVVNIQSLGLGLEPFPLNHPIISLSLLTLCLPALIIHTLGLGNKGKGESTLVKSKLT